MTLALILYVVVAFGVVFIIVFSNAGSNLFGLNTPDSPFYTVLMSVSGIIISSVVLLVLGAFCAGSCEAAGSSSCDNGCCRAVDDCLECLCT